MNTLQVNVVSAEEMIFSGRARFVALPGESGELGVYPRHTPLITRIKPGSVRIHMEDGQEEFVFVAGGILEIQPDVVTGLPYLKFPKPRHIIFYLVEACPFLDIILHSYFTPIMFILSFFNRFCKCCNYIVQCFRYGIKAGFFLQP